MSLAIAYSHNTILKARPYLLGRVAGRSFSSSIPRCKQRLVVLGSGWGGYNVLRSVDKKRWGEPESHPSSFPELGSIFFLPDVTVLSPNTYFNFTPLLASTAVGTLEFRCAIEPVSVDAIPNDRLCLISVDRRFVGTLLKW